MVFSVGLSEWLVILLVAVLLFGAKRIPELARSLGRARSEFKKGVSSDDDPEEGKPRTD
ncbi:MAG: twin-arginine translocase TatA/TatE family subunit [Candidatus Undinarchaeales archaeon]|jgi:sec-independent protein translocase protein TatA|nr:twin-arginine translocase TatA/TatE family subunit [Candidatus Undinarchaeales archaeon]MDP7491883.1 twin-arginine translocase TatA/TatE family subunit [Candidatus Undinarchaeales archaeon]